MSPWRSTVDDVSWDASLSVAAVGSRYPHDRSASTIRAAAAGGSSTTTSDRASRSAPASVSWPMRANGVARRHRPARAAAGGTGWIDGGSSTGPVRPATTSIGAVWAASSARQRRLGGAGPPSPRPTARSATWTSSTSRRPPSRRRDDAQRCRRRRRLDGDEPERLGRHRARRRGTPGPTRCRGRPTRRRTRPTAPRHDGGERRGRRRRCAGRPGRRRGRLAVAPAASASRSPRSAAGGPTVTTVTRRRSLGEPQRRSRARPRSASETPGPPLVAVDGDPLPADDDHDWRNTTPWPPSGTTTRSRPPRCTRGSRCRTRSTARS